MEILGYILSPFVARVVLAARHKGLKYTLSMPADGDKSPAFLKLNPFGRVPVLLDGKTVLYESGVILDYLDAKSKKKRLVPAAAKDVAKVRTIAALCGEYVQPACFTLFAQAAPATRDQKIVDEKLALLATVLGTLEKMVAVKPYAAGAKITLADFYLMPALFIVETVSPQLGITKPLGAYAKLTRFYAKARKDKLLGGVLTEMEAALGEYHARAAA
jgi:glutathione S-transferase